MGKCNQNKTENIKQTNKKQGLRIIENEDACIKESNFFLNIYIYIYIYIYLIHINTHLNY